MARRKKPDPPPAPKCERVLDGGKRCRAFAATGSKFCFFHDPKRRKDVDRAKRAGAAARNFQKFMSGGKLPKTLRTPQDVVDFLEVLTREAVTGGISGSVAAIAGKLAEAQLKAIELAGIEKPTPPRPKGLIIEQDSRDDDEPPKRRRSGTELTN